MLLLSILLRSTLLGVLGLATLRLLKGRSASLRHVVAAGTMLAMACVPVLSILLPRRTVDVSIAPEALIYVTGLGRQTESRAGIPEGATPSPLDFETIAVVLWLGVALALLVRLGNGVRLVRRRVARGRLLPLDRAVPVVEDATDPPIVAWTGTTILLPESWSRWPKDRLELVLAHEEAHVKRGDWCTQSVVQVLAALMWPNPAALPLARRIRALAEEAADDVVLDSGVQPASYAAALLSVARAASVAPAAAISMAAQAEIERRIEMILEPNRRRRAATIKTLVATALLLSLATVPVASWALTTTAHTTPALGGSTPLMILDQKDVQADLQLTPACIGRIESILANHRTQLTAARGSARSRLDYVSERERLASHLLTDLNAVLDATHRARLRQIFIQWRGNDALLDADVQAHLDLSLDQRSEISELARAYQEASVDRYRRGLAEVLTPAQSAELKRLGGRPFTGRIQGTLWSNGG